MSGSLWTLLFALMLLVPILRGISARSARVAVRLRRLSSRARRLLFLASLAALLIVTPKAPAPIVFALPILTRRTFPVGMLSSLIPAAMNPHLLSSHPLPSLRRAYQVMVAGSEGLEDRLQAVLPEHLHPMVPFLVVIATNPGRGALQVVITMQRVYVAIMQEISKLFAQRAGFLLAPFLLTIFELAIVMLAGVSPETEMLMDLSASAFLTIASLIIGEL